MSPHRRNTDGRPNIPNFTLLSCRLGGPQANQHIPDDPGKKKTFSVLYPLKPMEAESHDWNCPSTRDSAAHRGTISTEIREAPPFFYAEDYHQQYLAKNPDGYCPDHSCGVAFKSAALQVGGKA